MKHIARKRLASLFLSLVLCLTLILLFSGCDCMKFDNKSDKEELLTKRYSTGQIEKIKQDIEGGHLTFAAFKDTFTVECIRKTHQGFYVVLLLDDGRNAFVFFDQLEIMQGIFIAGHFQTKEEFLIHVTKGETQSEVLQKDPNAIMLPVSAVDITAHIVQGGVYIVQYNRMVDDSIIDDPIVSAIEFVSSERLVSESDYFIRHEIPFILEIDKTTEK